MNIGKWWWADWQWYPEGTVYRVRLGRLFIKSMVDCMTEHQRRETEQVLQRVRERLVP